MCDTCGCGDTKLVPVELHERLLADNDRTAAHNRAHFALHGVLAVNLMGSPGAGKTALLEATARAAGTARRLAAITGDLETDRDAWRLASAARASSISIPERSCRGSADSPRRGQGSVLADHRPPKGAHGSSGDLDPVGRGCQRPGCDHLHPHVGRDGG